MSVTILKAKDVVKTGTTPVKSDLSIKVDRLIELKATIDANKAAVDEYDKIRKELASLSDKIAAPNEPSTFEGDTGVISFSARNAERSISDMKGVFDLLGASTFFSICKVTLTDVDKYLGKAEQESVVSSNLTGARKVSIIAKE